MPTDSQQVFTDDDLQKLKGFCRLMTFIIQKRDDNKYLRLMVDEMDREKNAFLDGKCCDGL